MTISGTGQSSPITPEMAVLQIQEILQSCIAENQNNLNIAGFDLYAAKQYFDLNFSDVLTQENGSHFFSFDGLREYVLMILIPYFSVADMSEIVGSIQMCEKLKKAAHSWPGDQDLAQMNSNMGFYVSFENKSKHRQNQKSNPKIHHNHSNIEQKKLNKATKHQSL
jgi:hypothetical protein